MSASVAPLVLDEAFHAVTGSYHVALDHIQGSDECVRQSWIVTARRKEGTVRIQNTVMFRFRDAAHETSQGVRTARQDAANDAFAVVCVVMGDVVRPSRVPRRCLGRHDDGRRVTSIPCCLLCVVEWRSVGCKRRPGRWNSQML